VRRGLRVNIDLDAAASNLELIGKSVHGVPVIAVVKADAYGHGAVELSRKLLQAGAHSLAVAFVSEARTLRNAGVKAPILILFDRDDISSFFDLSLTPVLHDLKTAKEFDREAGKRKVRLDVHLKADTGMGRMGFEDEGSTALMQTLELRNINVAGFMSHFADADLEDKKFSHRQTEAFSGLRDRLAQKGINPLCHMANSAASLSLPEANFDAVRPGLALYGTSPFRDKDYGLRPVMSVSAGILTLRKVAKGKTISYGRTYKASRDMVAAVLAAGYADGFPRSLSNNAEVLIRGRRAPIVGRVCMDLSIADVTDIEGVTDTDEALILGSDGGETITAWDIAERAGTIPYEILIGLGRMSERVYS